MKTDKGLMAYIRDHANEFQGPADEAWENFLEEVFAGEQPEIFIYHGTMYRKQPDGTWKADR